MGVAKHDNACGCTLKEKQVQADVLCSFKMIFMDQPFHSDFCWVTSHKDNLRQWYQLTLTERMNVLTNLLAKKSLAASIVERDLICRNFPSDLIRVTMKGKLLTGFPRKVFEAYWGAKYV